jgi:catechol 2,3-dioxygenase-like lactoylglutathione lyase family enzyme
VKAPVVIVGIGADGWDGLSPRARRAVEDAGISSAGGLLVDLLIEEADARARAGDPAGAHELLTDARSRATALGDVERLGRAALGVHALGARFAMPRHAVVAVLDEARAAGATIGRPGAETFWGGYSGVFIDPDGHPWEVAHNPRWTVHDDGTTTLD